MTRFALTIWAYQITGKATTLALMAFFTFGPEIFMSPVARALVDRWNRKLTSLFLDRDCSHDPCPHRKQRNRLAAAESA